MRSISFCQPCSTPAMYEKVVSNRNTRQLMDDTEEFQNSRMMIQPRTKRPGKGNSIHPNMLGAVSPSLWPGAMCTCDATIQGTF